MLIWCTVEWGGCVGTSKGFLTQHLQRKDIFDRRLLRSLPVPTKTSHVFDWRRNSNALPCHAFLCTFWMENACWNTQHTARNENRKQEFIVLGKSDVFVASVSRSYTKRLYNAATTTSSRNSSFLSSYFQSLANLFRFGFGNSNIMTKVVVRCGAFSPVPNYFLALPNPVHAVLSIKFTKKTLFAIRATNVFRERRNFLERYTSRYVLFIICNDTTFTCFVVVPMLPSVSFCV